MSLAEISVAPRRSARLAPDRLGRLRLFLSMIRIDVLRSWAWAVIPLMVVFGAVFVREQLVPGVVLWDDLSAKVGATTLFLAPLAMGYTAWRLQSARQARIVELESASPTSPLIRDLRRIVASTLVVVMGQIVLVGLALVYGARLATWGEPMWWPLALSIATIFLAGAVGGSIGAFAPWRMVPPLIAVATLAVCLAVNSAVLGYERTNSLAMFSPFVVAERQMFDPFWNGDTPATARTLTVLVVLAGFAALSLVVFARHRNVAAWILAAAMCGSMAFAGAMHWDHWQAAQMMGIYVNDPRSFTYACEPWRDGSICVHPAYASLTDELRAEADYVLAPVAGLPGVPTSIRHMSRDVPADGQTVWISTRGLYDDWQQQYGAIIIRQVIGLAPAHEAFPILSRSLPNQPDAAQMVMGRWLTAEAGLDSRLMFGPIAPTDLAGPDWYPQSTGPEPAWWVEVNAAIERFGALPPEEQRPWLEANREALRVGELTLEDLP